MNELDLKREVFQFPQVFKAFELILGYRRRLGMTNDQLAVDLCGFYATWSAFKILRRMGSTSDSQWALNHGLNISTVLDFREELPRYEAIDRAAHDLILAIEKGDRTAELIAMREMRLFSYCPAPEARFPRMEDITSRVSGRSQQLFLVELARFATEVGEYQRATKYIKQARSFSPSSRELYNICVFEGLIALAEGSADEAIQCLHCSIKACQADVDSSIQCSLLAPNLEIAERLLEVGERVIVVEYLHACHNVWQLLRPEIENWIHVIEGGGRPRFQIAAPIEEEDGLLRTINMQWMRCCTLELEQDRPRIITPMSPAQVLAQRERRQSESERRMSAHIKKKLEYLERDPLVPPE